MSVYGVILVDLMFVLMVNVCVKNLMVEEKEKWMLISLRFFCVVLFVIINLDDIVEFLLLYLSNNELEFVEFV